MNVNTKQVSVWQNCLFSEAEKYCQSKFYTNFSYILLMKTCKVNAAYKVVYFWENIHEETFLFNTATSKMSGLEDINHFKMQNFRNQEKTDMKCYNTLVKKYQEKKCYILWSQDIY